ncbi:unnamed protein product [Spirodela intermedia]|uniref:Uncharacterized protein n=1 Tax=Spirodela intermedia TaxID=51605 RepID=A0A7I8J141_SPIIN|nr:unnamed protein product [Spirodela intermedia]CAA6663682.1 unnamed protein product [Spirodela intermedia]
MDPRPLRRTGVAREHLHGGAARPPPGWPPTRAGLLSPADLRRGFSARQAFLLSYRLSAPESFRERTARTTEELSAGARTALRRLSPARWVHKLVGALRGWLRRRRRR